ncbi:MAG TPA: AMP-binding protein, partial [Thermoanaerobaculia bacterium]|nr:AMP-binding protein [Thermoanaerobaculia bacterium]
MAQTVFQRLAATAAAYPEHPALKVKRGADWHTTSWREYRDQVLAVAAGLVRLGVDPGKGVAIMGFNRPEWFLADLGAIAAGAVPTGIYTTNSVDQCQYVADHCEAQIVVVEHREYLDVFLGLRDRLPHLKALVLMDGDAPPGVVSWRDLLALGTAEDAAEVQRRLDAQGPEDLCTLIYTSGTTGPPKGVMICHRNLLFVGDVLAESFELGPDDRALSYLPLSHIAEQVVSLHGPMKGGACTWFAESLEKLGDNLREARPTFFFAVPRVWEKIQAKMQAAGAQNPPLKRKIAAWARKQGLAGSQAEQEGRPRPALYGLANKLVFSKVRERLGLDASRICTTSAAPISRDTLDFFASLGITILEVYGMSECTGPTTLSLPDRYELGKAGFAMKGSELKTAEDGEILMRGPHVCLGYYKNPEATAETIDAEGWIHSGDIGSIDERGFLSVTDRKKELLITSGGKNVAPQPIEALLKGIPVVGQAVLLGDRRNFIAALLTLDPERLPEEAAKAGSPARTEAEAAVCP